MTAIPVAREPVPPKPERAVHPAANLFPHLVGEQFDELLADIQVHGVREAGWLDQNGWILDGRNRERACRQLGVEMPWRVYGGASDTEVDFIISLNLHRRHLTDDQRAAIAADLATMRQGERTDLSPNGGRLSQAAAAEGAEGSQASGRAGRGRQEA